MRSASDSAAKLEAGVVIKAPVDSRPILFVVDSYLPGVGGAELQAVLLARALRDRGKEVHFVAPRLFKDLPVKDEIEGFKVTRIDYPRIRFLGALLLMLYFSLYMIRHRNDYSFIHVHVTKLLATCLGIVKPFLSARVMTKISGHAEFSGGILDPERSSNLVYRIMSYYIRKLDYIQTISVYTRERLLAQGFKEKQIAQIPNAVDVSRFSEPDCFANENNPLVIGFCGRIREVKGLELLVQAVSSLDEETAAKIHVSIAGDGRHRSEVERFVGERGVTAKFTFVGAITDVPAFLKTLDIYVQPSYAEGLSNSVLEAMSASLPVVASNVSGNVDLVDHNRTGCLFNSGDSDELAKLLESLIDDRDKRISMGKAGRVRVVDTYGIESVSKKLMELYSNAII